MSVKKTHSVKVPRLYKVATNIFKAFKERKDSVKNLVYEARKKHPNIKALFALVNECVNHEQVLSGVFLKLDILENEKPLDKNLALILTTELIFGKKALPGESKPIQTILKYHKKIEKALENVNLPERSGKKSRQNPRFVRVNLIKTTLELTLTHFKRDGYVLIETPKKYDEFIKAIQNLNETEFMLDYHMPSYLIVFPYKTQLYNHPMYLDGSIVLQDKASCLSVEALNPPPGSTLLDACAAPGMKTCQAVAKICEKSQNGKIFAIERNGKRCKVLKQILRKNCNEVESNIEVIQSDFLSLNPQDFDQVEYIVADPTCSGSGTDTKKDDSEERLAKLANLQTMILKHAFKFPKLKRIAYSTCSVNQEENENVVEEILKHVEGRFELVQAMPNWSRRGVQGYEQCLRVDPTSDLCTGFFVAVFEKIGS